MLISKLDRDTYLRKRAPFLPRIGAPLRLRTLKEVEALGKEMEASIDQGHKDSQSRLLGEGRDLGRVVGMSLQSAIKVFSSSLSDDGHVVTTTGVGWYWWRITEVSVEPTQLELF